MRGVFGQYCPVAASKLLNAGAPSSYGSPLGSTRATGSPLQYFMGPAAVASRGKLTSEAPLIPAIHLQPVFKFQVGSVCLHTGGSSTQKVDPWFFVTFVAAPVYAEYVAHHAAPDSVYTSFQQTGQSPSG